MSWRCRYRYLADRPGMRYTHTEPTQAELLAWLDRNTGKMEVYDIWAEPAVPKVWNRYRDSGTPRTAVYIGRPSKWGNPFQIGPDGTRDDVLALYTKWIYAPAQIELRMAAARELVGRDLVCFCKPLACHGDILLKIANE